MKAQLIVEITPDGIVVTGCENIPVPNYSVEQQAMNPLLGVGYAGRSIDEAFRFITQVAEKVCQEQPVPVSDPTSQTPEETAFWQKAEEQQ